MKILKNLLNLLGILVIFTAIWILVPSINAQISKPIPPSKSQKTQKQPLRIMKPIQFCTRLADSLEQQQIIQSTSEAHRKAYALEGAIQIVDMLRDGKIEEYIHTGSFNFAKQSDRIYVKKKYIPLARLSKQALGISKPILLALSTYDLRSVPRAQQGSEIVLITNTKEPLDAKNSKSLVYMARLLKIHISVIWVGKDLSSEEGQKEASALAMISGLTNGLYVNLGGETNPCINKS